MKNLSYSIRPLTARDLPTLEIHFPEPKPGSHAQRLHAQDEGRLSYSCIIVDSCIIGIQLVRWDGPSDPRHRHLSIYPEIGSIYILPTFRKQGFASALLRYSEKLIKQKGFAHAGLIVKDNNTPSISLHLQAGYKVIGAAQPSDNNPEQSRSYYLKRL